ncbi:peptidylprolyl isomerase [Candidatus Woesearchaeota archaeon]|jgi:FKBP-type peptidyl-prolyl cis-trans isomerase SlyD|nr:peptidylprolyl isomerase [Candidatus Woesearchaeota archaeon]MBT5740585.1 peptidylprolyl isomerase [Candidatus Woesearchaeota archaeon]
MTETVKTHDFIVVEYTGKLQDGTVFDTTIAKVAKDNGLFSDKHPYNPATVCVGEKQLLPGLDNEFIDKEVGKTYTATLTPEQAFGKRDVKNMRIMPMGAFKEHKMTPQPGLQINVDGQIGTITRVAGGRVIVNFNHPLAGKEVMYEFTIQKKITQKNEQISKFLNRTLRIPEDKITVEVKEDKAKVSLPMPLPAPVLEVLTKKLQEVTGIKEVEFPTKQSS